MPPDDAAHIPSSGPGSAEAMDDLLSLILRAVSSTAGAIVLLDEAGEHTLATERVPPEALHDARPLARAVFAAEGLLRVHDAPADPRLRWLRLVQGPPERRSLVAATLPLTRGELLVVVMHEEAGRHDKSDAELVLGAARIARRALQRGVASPGAPRPVAPDAAPLAPADPLRAAGRSPVATILAKKWTPTILRELARTPGARFSELMARLPGISSRTLSDRLKEMQGAGLLDREQAQTIPVRVAYKLTERGADAADAVADLETRPLGPESR